MIETITLRNLLPLVFRGMEDSIKIKSSEIWQENSVVLSHNCRVCIKADCGSGKSSLLSFVYGNRSDYSGNILFNEKNIRTFSVEQWCETRKRHIALLPQEMRLFPELTVAQNIELKNSLTNHKNTAQIKELLDRMGIVDKYDKPAGLLSIGQQQRVALIRAICQPFDFIFLDEPVSHLDVQNNKIAANIIEEEASMQNAGIVTTSVGNHLLIENAKFIAL